LHPLDKLLPPNTVFAAEDSIDPTDRLDSTELAAIAKAVDKRRREFTLGRFCARAAMRRLGVPVAAVPVGERREPLWPEGIVGSISHSGSHAVAVVARSRDYVSLGVDVEIARSLEVGIRERIGTAEELRDIAGHPLCIDLEPAASAALLFAAKEAIYKCCFPVAREFLSFEDVRWLPIGPDRFRAEPVGNGKPASRIPLQKIQGRMTLDAGGCWALAWIEQHQSAPPEG
jgi:4'-phosphopantetheinyl transferase EntD